MARKIIDIDVEEVSIVDAAANKSRFAIIKRREMMEEFVKLVKSLVGDELTEEELEKVSKQELPADQLKAVSSALSTLSKYKADFPADILGAIKTLAKYTAAPAAPAEAKRKGEEVAKEDMEKIGARLSKATLSELQKISDMLKGIDVKAIKQVRDAVENLILTAMPRTVEAAKYAGLPEDVRARLMKLDEDEAKAAQQAEVKKQADVLKTLVAEVVKPLQDEIAELKKSKGVSKSAKGQEEKKDADATNLWPSLS